MGTEHLLTHQFNSIIYKENQGKPFCSKCYDARFGETCHGCGKIIGVGMVTRVGGNAYVRLFASNQILTFTAS
jgi:hypothetical protein